MTGRPTYDRILLGVDKSEHSTAAVGHAAAIARHFGSEVLVLHVREPRLAETGDHLETELDAAELAEWAAEELRSAGAKARAEIRDSRSGGVARAILAAAQDYQPSLIVLGTRGLTNLQGLLVGSVSFKVLHLGHCAVLPVR